jgi:hypothetical protein
MDENNFHCTSIWGILVNDNNKLTTDRYEIKISQVLQSDWQVRPMDGWMDLALHMGLMWINGHIGNGTQPSTPINNFSCKPSSHISPQAISSNQRPPPVTTGYLWLPIPSWNISYLVWSCSVSFTGESYSPNFDMKYMMPKYIRDFSWEKWPKFVKFRITSVLWWLREGSQEYRRFLVFFLFFLPSCLVCNQIWLNCFLDDRQFGYYHNKILKSQENTAPVPWVWS